jgi:GT2 family glycosyltransferase
LILISTSDWYLHPHMKSASTYNPLKAFHGDCSARADTKTREHESPIISIIILNWNGWKDTLDCLQSLHRITYPNYRVIIVDNGSTDDSIDKIRAYYETASRARVISVINHNQESHIAEPTCNRDGATTEFAQIKSDSFDSGEVVIIRNDQNYGYAEGNNIGMRLALKCRSDAALLLNNDTVVDPDFLTELVKAFEDRQSAGFFGPKIYYYERNGRKDVISHAGGILNAVTGTCHPIGKNEVDSGKYDVIREVDYIEGSCMLASAEVIDKIGMLDPTFFAYWDDVDWCVRGSEEGYKSVYVPTARVWHKTYASDVMSMSIYRMVRNQFWFVKKHNSPMRYQFFLLYYFLWPFWLLSASFLFYRRSASSLRAFWKAVFEGVFHEGIGNPQEAH